MRVVGAGRHKRALGICLAVDVPADLVVILIQNWEFQPIPPPLLIEFKLMDCPENFSNFAIYALAINESPTEESLTKFTVFALSLHIGKQQNRLSLTFSTTACHPLIVVLPSDL
jgi:hypothetical protein